MVVGLVGLGEIRYYMDSGVRKILTWLLDFGVCCNWIRLGQAREEVLIGFFLV